MARSQILVQPFIFNLSFFFFSLLKKPFYTTYFHTSIANYRGDFSERSPLAQEYFVEVNMNQDQLDIESLWKISFWAVNRCMFSFSWGDYFHKALELEPVWSWAAGTDTEGAVGGLQLGLLSLMSLFWLQSPSFTLLCFPPLLIFSITLCYLKSSCKNSTKLSPLIEMGSPCFQKGKNFLASSNSVTHMEP